MLPSLSEPSIPVVISSSKSNLTRPAYTSTRLQRPLLTRELIPNSPSLGSPVALVQLSPTTSRSFLASSPSESRGHKVHRDRWELRDLKDQRVLLVRHERRDRKVIRVLLAQRAHKVPKEYRVQLAPQVRVCRRVARPAKYCRRPARL